MLKYSKERGCVDPMDREAYRRDGMKATEAPLKKVTRDIAPATVAWCGRVPPDAKRRESRTVGSLRLLPHP
jgi:hypothetical protein